MNAQKSVLLWTSILTAALYHLLSVIIAYLISF